MGSLERPTYVLQVEKAAFERALLAGEPSQHTAAGVAPDAGQHQDVSLRPRNPLNGPVAHLVHVDQACPSCQHAYEK